MALTAPVLVPVVAVVKRAVIAWPKRTSLPSILPATGSTPSAVSNGIAGGFRPVDDDDADDEQERPWSRGSRGPGGCRRRRGRRRGRRRRGSSSSAQISQDVGPGVGILERMRGIGVEEAAAVGAELLDRSPGSPSARSRSSAWRLRASSRRPSRRASAARRARQERARRRSRSAAGRRASTRVISTQKLPTVVARRAREGAHQREGHREAGRGREEIMNGEAEHLGEMAHRRLAAVVLPVGVGDEADRRVEGEIGRDGVEALRVERQKVLKPLQRVEREEAGDGKGEHRDRVDEPALLARRVDAGQADRSRARPGRSTGRESCRSPA